MKGSGVPLVLVPGIQGRWEWMAPAVEALARRFRVVTFSLAGEPGADTDPDDPRGLAFDTYVSQIDQALDAASVDRAIVCGVSYGGLVALRFAATRRERTAALVLVSTPAPRWQPEARVRRYVAAPWRSAPRFLLGAHQRLWREIAAARPRRWDRWATMARYLGAIAAHPTSPGRMAARARLMEGREFVSEARSVRAPTLVVTGEADLDRVVPVAGTREYLSLVPGSTGRTLARTGHIGLVTRPDVFALLVWEFAASAVEGREGAALRGDA